MNFSDNQKKVVIYLTIFIGITIIAVTMITYNSFMQDIPTPPSLKTGKDRTTQMVTDEINNYKNLVTTIKENNIFLYDLLILKFLKGLFDSLIIVIISYIFGKPIVAALAERIEKGN